MMERQRGSLVLLKFAESIRKWDHAPWSISTGHLGDGSSSSSSSSGFLLLLQPHHLTQNPTPYSFPSFAFAPHSFHSLHFSHNNNKSTTSALIARYSDADAPVLEAESETETETTDVVVSQVDDEAVAMIGGRQYIVFPGRFLYTQRLKGANVNDKVVLNKVLLVGNKTRTWISKPIVQNAAVHAVVEEQGLDHKVIVFKYKRKKNYRRNIGHRQPTTRIRITGIMGHENSPFVTLDS